MAVPAAALGPSALGPSGPGALAPWCAVSSGPTRYVLGMQELFRGHSKTREFPAHSAKVHSVAWSCDGRRLASGSFDKTASVFLLEKDRLVSGPASGVWGVGPRPGLRGRAPRCAEGPSRGPLRDVALGACRRPTRFRLARQRVRPNPPGRPPELGVAPSQAKKVYYHFSELRGGGIDTCC